MRVCTEGTSMVGEVKPPTEQDATSILSRKRASRRDASLKKRFSMTVRSRSRSPPLPPAGTRGMAALSVVAGRAASAELQILRAHKRELDRYRQLLPDMIAAPAGRFPSCPSRRLRAKPFTRVDISLIICKLPKNKPKWSPLDGVTGCQNLLGTTQRSPNCALCR